jgi:large subunit ribosomal protein L2
MKKYKPTTPGTRGKTSVDYSVLTVGKPHKALTKKIKSHAGRNNRGVITVRHQGAGNKKLYRMVDFRRDKPGIPGRIETVEYDPYRTSFISLVLYKDGERRYIIAPQKIKVGDEIITDEKTEVKLANRMILANIPVGTFVYNVELRRGGGGKLARSAGSYAEILAHDAGYTDLKLASKEIRKVSSNNYASVGIVSNPEHNLVTIGKAGRNRWKGIRPTVRGAAMNPVDHPYGGGEGKQRRGTKRPKTKWGKVTGGRKTRPRKKWSNKMIIKRRKTNKR